MRGTRADLHQNALKWFRNLFLTSDFEHGADWNKTRKVSSRFLPLSAKLSVQKRRMPFSDFYEAGIGVKPLPGKLFSMFPGIKQANRVGNRWLSRKDAQRVSLLGVVRSGLGKNG